MARTKELEASEEDVALKEMTTPTARDIFSYLFIVAGRAQVVGWPPIRSFRKNTMASHPPKNDDEAEPKLGSGCLYVKVSMDGAPHLRKVDLKIHGSY